MQNEGLQLSARDAGGQAATATSFDGILRTTPEPGPDALSDTIGAAAPAHVDTPDYAFSNNRLGWRMLASKAGIGVLVALVLIGSVITLVRRASRPVTAEVGSFGNTHLPLGQVAGDQAVQLGVGQSLLVNGQLKVSNTVVISPSEQPANPTTGQLYFDQNTKQLAYYNGNEFLSLGGTTGLVQNTTNTTNITNVTGAGGLTAIGGTANTVPKFVNSQRLGNSIISDDGSTVTISGELNLSSASSAPSTELTIFPANPTPAVPASNDTQAVEIGVKFSTDVSGFVKGIRFYKGTTNTGTHVGNLWSSSGTLLATATFTNETADGWQEVRFAAPVAIAAETTYIASYYAPIGRYAINTAYFSSGGVDNGSLHALRDGADGGNGVFRYSGASVFPSQGFGGANYWVDTIFTPNPTPPRIRMNGVQIASSDLSNNGELAKRGSSQVFTGNNTFRSSADSTASFSIQNASGSSMLTTDTASGRVYIGMVGGTGDPEGVLLVLSNRPNVDDPAGVEGGMYYNRAERMFRCYRDGTWSPCASLEVGHGFDKYDEFMGNQTTSFGGSIGELGWQALAIGANGSLSYNPATPTPDATRPGILALQTPAVANQGTTFILGSSGGGSMIVGKDNIVRTTAAVGAATNQVLRVGLHGETTSTTQPVSGVWWEADPAAHVKWRYCFGNGTTATCNPSTIDITANAWVRLEIRVTGTGTGTSSAIFLINDISSLVSNVTIDTANRVSPAYSCYTTTGTAQNCYWDYFQLIGTTATAR